MEYKGKPQQLQYNYVQDNQNYIKDKKKRKEKRKERKRNIKRKYPN